MHPPMARAEHPIEIPATPARDEVDPDLEGSRHTQQRLQGERVNVAALNPRNRRGGHVRPLPNIALPHAPTQANGPEDLTQADTVHAPSMGGDPLSAGYRGSDPSRASRIRFRSRPPE